MIVKNEALIIERCLDSVKDIIDCLYILDTGSIDNTIQVIEDWCKRNDIEGIVETGEFKNFAQARNDALQGALESSLDFDALLFLDAGMALEGIDNPKVGFPHLKRDCHYTLKQKYGNLEYFNTRIVGADLAAKWAGVCHEYLEVPEPPVQLHSLTIQCHSDGGNQTGQMERYRDLLIQGLKDEPGNSRYLFYLAQTYFDLQNWQYAADYYQQRIVAGGWDEEIWYAKFRYALSLSYWSPDAFKQVTDAFLEAYYSRPWRVEPLVYLACYLKKTQPIGIFLEPKTDVLFVEEALYAK